MRRHEVAWLSAYLPWRCVHRIDLDQPPSLSSPAGAALSRASLARRAEKTANMAHHCHRSARPPIAQLLHWTGCCAVPLLTFRTTEPTHPRPASSAVGEVPGPPTEPPLQADRILYKYTPAWARQAPILALAPLQHVNEETLTVPHGLAYRWIWTIGTGPTPR